MDDSLRNCCLSCAIRFARSSKHIRLPDRQKRQTSCCQLRLRHSRTPPCSFLGRRCIRESLVAPFKAHLLTKLTERAKQITSKSNANVYFREIALLSKTSPFITNGDEAAGLVLLFLPQLRKRKGVSDKMKSEILSILCNLVPLVSDDELILSIIYETLSQLLQTCRGRQVRSDVLKCLKVFSTMTNPR